MFSNFIAEHEHWFSHVISHDIKSWHINLFKFKATQQAECPITELHKLNKKWNRKWNMMFYLRCMDRERVGDINLGQGVRATHQILISAKWRIEPRPNTYCTSLNWTDADIQIYTFWSSLKHSATLNLHNKLKLQCICYHTPCNSFWLKSRVSNTSFIVWSLQHSKFHNRWRYPLANSKFGSSFVCTKFDVYVNKEFATKM